MAKKRTIELTIAGYTFSLKNLKVHNDMSDETTCFSADLVCNGKVIAHCSNDGRGGCTDVRCYGNDPNYDLYRTSLTAIAPIRDTEYEKEAHERLKQYSWYKKKECVQYYTDEHLAEQLMLKQSAWDDAVKQLKKFAKKQHPDMQIWFNGETMVACTDTTFVSTDGTKYENVTQWVR